MVQNNVIAAFNSSQGELLTGISKRQLRSWARDGFYVPSLTAGGAEAPATHYNFRDLLCLKVLSALRNEAKISLSELKATKDKLWRLDDEMWLKTTLYVLENRVVFDSPETDEKEEVATQQGVLQIPLKEVSSKMQDLVRAMRQRRRDSSGKITRTRNVVQNQPVLAGTRIPVRAVQSFAKAGYSVDQIIQQYPSLTEEDVRAALHYQDVA
jgi:uncharacterized protein (DUF433 family)